MGIIVSDIITEYGAYYLKSEANMNRLKNLLLFGRETTKHATPIRTDDTIYRMADASVSDLVQPFQKSWTPKGDVTFKPNPIQLFKMKVDFEVYPDDIEATWLGFLASDSQNRKDWPLIRYIMEVHLLNKVNENMELKEYYKGVYAAPTAGTAGATGTSMNGLKQTLANESVNRLTMTAFDPATIYDQIEAAYDQVAEEYQTTEMIVGLAPKWYRAFLRDKRTLGYYQLEGPGSIDNTIDFAPGKVVGLPSMVGTNDVFITPKANFLHVTKKFQNASKLKVEEYHRLVSILADWWEGLGFAVNELVWTNVPATP